MINVVSKLNLSLLGRRASSPTILQVGLEARRPLKNNNKFSQFFIRF